MKKKRAIACLLTCTLLVSGMGNMSALGEEITVWENMEGDTGADTGENHTETPSTEGYAVQTETYFPQDNFQEWTESYYYDETGMPDYEPEYIEESYYPPEERREFWDERENAYEENREGTVRKNSEDVYTVEDFDIPDAEDAKADFALSEASELPNQMYLQVPEILQNPELPTGCEAVSLTMALQYEGFDVDKITVASDYLIYNYESDNMAIGYVGDPFSEEGAGCFAPAIAATALALFTDQEASYKAYDITETNFEDLFAYIAAGTPVILWTTMYMAEPEFTRMDTEYNGRVYRWYRQEHCVVLSGYNLEERTVQINDPLEGIVSRNMDEFASIYNLTGKNAVVLKETGEAGASGSAMVNTEVGLP